jgi:hypothetical protein
MASEEKYYFLLDLGQGRYQRGTSDTDSTMLRECDTEKPNLSYDVVEVTVRGNYLWPQWATLSRERQRNCILTVPKGTVVQKFEVK